jgi:hypothetical protein
MDKLKAQIILDPRFDDCGFLRVKINKRLKITDHGIVLWKGWPNQSRVTVFVFHKLLFFTCLLFTLVHDIYKNIYLDF